MKSIQPLFLILALSTNIAADPRHLCFEKAQIDVPCPPGDLLYDLPWVGFATESSACRHDGVKFAQVGLALSASATDPMMNEGTIPADGRLYLWLVSAPWPSYGFVGLHAVISGDLPIARYEAVAPDPYSWNASTQELIWS